MEEHAIKITCTPVPFLAVMRDGEVITFDHEDWARGITLNKGDIPLEVDCQGNVLT